MAPQSRGKTDKNARAFKVIKHSKRTQTTKQYRFRSFSDRIAKSNIDPVRRTEARRDDFEADDATSSHFRNAVEDWRDRNLTDHFSSFVRDVEPLAESLPQLLYNADRVAELLFQSIKNGTSLSLEPLLDLLAQFAHDLGSRFETYFESSLHALIHVARTNEDIEVIERSLNSLVWLFKYLSRLLVPDLRPTYDLLAPLMGKERQKPFIARFAAEAFSFLLRRAATKYARNAEPLSKIMQHVLSDVEEAGENELYQRAVMTLFLEGMKGVQHGLHSSGLPILQELLKRRQGQKHLYPIQDAVTRGVLIALIHHCTPQTFNPVLEEVLRMIDNTSYALRSYSRNVSLLHMVTAVRKGARITDWDSIYERLEALSTEIGDDVLVLSGQQSAHRNILVTAAVIMHSSPLQDALKHVRLVERLSTSSALAKHFFFFCDYLALINPERFRTIALPTVRKLLLRKSSDADPALLLLSSRLRRAGVSKSSSDALVIGTGLKEKIAHDFRQLAQSRGDAELLYTCNSELDVLSSPAEAPDLMAFLQDDTAITSSSDRDLSDFTWGTMFRTLGAIATDKIALLRKALGQQSTCVGFVPFWLGFEALLSDLTASNAHRELELEMSEVEAILASVQITLSLPSHELRLAGLRIVQHIFSLWGKDIPAVINIALSIEQSSFDAQSARSISMHVRRLATSFGDIISDNRMVKLITAYFFGLLHVHLASVWNDVSEAFKIVCGYGTCHDAVMDIAVKWMIGSEQEYDELSMQETEDDTLEKKFYTDFECSNVAQLDTIASKSWHRMKNARDELRRSFEHAHRRVPTVTKHCREQALKILNAIPSVAEKRSRLVVPLFLEWASHADSADDTDGSDATITESSRQRWNRKDQKAMATLFASIGNPKVLYRADEVHGALLGLLANGDSELQKPALNALLTWRSAVLGRYKEDLLNLLDDDRFRDTLAKIQIVGEDIEDPAIREEDRGDLMPVLLRILYGRTIAKGGVSARGGGLDARKKAVFAAVKRFGDDELRDFLAISLGPLQDVEPLSESGSLPIRKQQGLLNTLRGMITVLRQDAEPLRKQLADAVLCCVLRNFTARDETNTEGVVGVDSLVKDVRQLSLQCLASLSELFPSHDWASHMDAVYKRVITPRLPKLPIETAHSVSGLLKIFASWAKSSYTAIFLATYNDTVLPQLAACLQVESAKDEVKLFIVGSIFMPILQLANSSGVISDASTRHAPLLLAGAEHVLRGSPSKDLLDLTVSFVSQLSPFVPVEDCLGLIEVSTFLLKQPSGRVSPKVKNRILRAPLVLFSGLQTPVENSEERGSSMQQLCTAFRVTFAVKSSGKGSLDAQTIAEDAYNTVASLFAFFEDRESRTVLSNTLEILATPCPDLMKAATICTDLNAFDDTRLDEPAWDVRGSGWAKATSFDPSTKLAGWVPLVWNALFYIRGEEDVLRSHAAAFLKRFIDAIHDTPSSDGSFLAFTDLSLLQAVHRGMRLSSEEVRSTYLDVIAHAVRVLPHWAAINDMQGLLVGTDEEEASFFNNVLHIQQHRRLRALRRLTNEAATGVLSSGNIARLLIPLLDHFVFDQRLVGENGEKEASNDGNLAAEAVTSIGALARWLDWPQYRAILRRYAGYVKERPAQEKIIMRLLGVLVDALSAASTQKSMAIDASPDVPICRLAKTMPQRERLSEDLSKQMLPQLTQYLRDKDETAVSRRAPVAVTVVKLLLLLPEDDFASRLPPVFMDLSHVLRSKAQESRDLTRRTMAEIATLIGPAYFGFVLKELRRALQRGYQLHVLSFTVHSILVQTAAVFSPGDLNYCVSEVMNVIMDDIFGVTGQEKDAEEYVSKMKEVKSSKSYDSMELIASLTTLTHLVELVKPVQALLRQKLDDRLAKKVDELLRRIRRGLVRNHAVAQQGILVFCHEIWSDTYRKIEPAAKENRTDYRTKRYLINMKAARKATNRGSTSVQNSRVICFAIDLMRDIIPKNEELHTPAKLSGFMGMVGDAVVSGDEDVRIAVFKLIASILRVVKAPFERLDKDAAVYAREAMRVVRDAHSTKTVGAQAALRMASEILQKRADTVIRDSDAALLLTALKDDLDEPERQAPAFGFLRAVIARRIIIPEVYNVIDSVARIMVTNHSKETRKLARDTYFAFMMDYPQAKGRLDKQVAYLVKNLSYQHLEGRQSVMEVLHLILAKVGDDLVGTIQDLVFLPTVMAMMNDEEEQCRAFAGVLLKDLFERADAARNKSWLKLMQGWINQSSNAVLRQAGFQCWELYLEAVPNAAERTKAWTSAVERVLSGYEEDTEDVSADLIYFALKGFAGWARLSKDAAYSPNLGRIWSHIREAQFFPGPWVRLVAMQLISTYLSHFAKTSTDLAAVPLVGSQGLEVDQQSLLQIARASLIAFQISDVNTDLVDQAARNLGFITRCFAGSGMPWAYGSRADIKSTTMANGHVGDLNDEWGGVSDEEDVDIMNTDAAERQTAFDHVIVELNAVMRRETAASGPNAARSLYPKTAAMKLLAALLSSNPLTPERSLSLAPVILRTLNSLTDPTMTHATSGNAEYSVAQTNLIESARNLMSKLQDTLGNEEYHAALMGVKKEARERRDERRRKRKLDVINEPERMDTLKRKKRDAAKVRRKVKNQEMRGRRRGW